MPKLITVTDMMRSFSDIVGRVYYKGETFDIKKGTNVVARLSPTKKKVTLAVSELNEFFKLSPRLNKAEAEDFEKVINEVKSLNEIGRGRKWD